MKFLVLLPILDIDAACFQWLRNFLDLFGSPLCATGLPEWELSPLASPADPAAAAGGEATAMELARTAPRRSASRPAADVKRGMPEGDGSRSRRKFCRPTVSQTCKVHQI